MSGLRVVVVLVAYCALPACILPMPWSYVTEMQPVNGSVYGPLDEDVPVEIRAYVDGGDAARVDKAGIAVVRSAPWAKLIGIGMYWSVGFAADRAAQYPDHVLIPQAIGVPVQIGKLLPKIKRRARKNGGNVILIRRFGKWRGYFDVYREGLDP